MEKKLILVLKVTLCVKEAVTASVDLIKTDSGDKHNQMISLNSAKGLRPIYDPFAEISYFRMNITFLMLISNDFAFCLH